jgi:hypothetical protein
LRNFFPEKRVLEKLFVLLIPERDELYRRQNMTNESERYRKHLYTFSMRIPMSLKRDLLREAARRQMELGTRQGIGTVAASIVAEFLNSAAAK